MQDLEESRPESPTSVFYVFNSDEVPSSPPSINFRRRQMRGGTYAHERRVIIGILPEDSDGISIIDDEQLHDSAFEEDEAENLSQRFNEVVKKQQHQILSNVFVDCPVCLVEEVVKENDGIMLVCGHSFHDTCIRKWLRLHDTCPICRKIVTS